MLYEQREYMKKKLVVLLTVRIILWRFFITYLVGIDIAKYKHDCFIHDHNGEVIRHSFTFVNNQNGFNQLLLILKFFDKNQKMDFIVIVRNKFLESSYKDNIEDLKYLYDKINKRMEK